MTEKDAWHEMDAWCEMRAAALKAKAEAHIMAGRSMKSLRYRTILGEHRSYMAMRSFIHGARENKE